MRGTIGSFVHFNWSFSGDGNFVDWGLMNEDATVISQLLLTLPKSGSALVTPPPAYTGRVSGSRSGNNVTFTLNNLQKGDSRFYVCRIRSPPGGSIQMDIVKLVVEGE